MYEAIRMHVEGLVEDKQPIPTSDRDELLLWLGQAWALRTNNATASSRTGLIRHSYNPHLEPESRNGHEFEPKRHCAHPPGR
jgi:hypothetical protein